MIQAMNIKHIEPKAAAKAAKAATKGEAEVLDPESMLDNADFANELSASISGEEAKLEVKPVKVSAEQMMQNPSSLIKLQESSPDAVNPKVFDPSLTQGVDKIVQPKTTAVEGEMNVEQLLAQGKTVTPEMGTNAKVVNPEAALTEGKVEVANVVANPEMEGEIAQAMLKTPQVQSAQVGRSPALDLAKGEVDPQLVNMEDFVAQKNLAVKKSLNNASAYGMPHKGAAKAAASENGLTQTQTVNELGSAQSGASGSGSSASGMNSQQFILSSQVELGANAQVNEAQAPMKTFNMSHIKTDNPNQIMTQITDYIVQAKAAKEPTVNMRVNHEELGMIDITVQKMPAGQDAIAINIATHSADGKSFFQANSKDLFSHLTSTGLNVSDIKVETPTQTAKNDFDFGGQSGRGGSSAGQEKQFGSEQNQRRHDSEKRQDLWNLFKDKEAA